VYFRLLLPEIRRQSAFDAKVIELQLDFHYIFGKIAARIICTDVKSGHPVSVA